MVPHEQEGRECRKVDGTFSERGEEKKNLLPNEKERGVIDRVVA
jgi:hypothetical protein